MVRQVLYSATSTVLRLVSSIAAAPSAEVLRLAAFGAAALRPAVLREVALLVAIVALGIRRSLVARRRVASIWRVAPVPRRNSCIRRVQSQASPP